MDRPQPDQSDHPQGQTPSPDPDAALLARHAAGDAEALGQLLQSHADRLYRLCLRMSHNAATAEELTQDTMVRIIAGLHHFDGRASFKTWITRITVNVCITHLRKTRGHRSRPPNPESQPASRASSYYGRGSSPDGVDALSLTEDKCEPSPAAGVQSSEAVADLLDALATLDPEHRTLLILRDQHEHDYAMLAEVFSVPVGTIKSRLFRARQMLRQAIESIRQQRTTPPAPPQTPPVP